MILIITNQDFDISSLFVCPWQIGDFDAALNIFVQRGVIRLMLIVFISFLIVLYLLLLLILFLYILKYLIILFKFVRFSFSPTVGAILSNLGAMFDV